MSEELQVDRIIVFGFKVTENVMKKISKSYQKNNSNL